MIFQIDLHITILFKDISRLLLPMIVEVWKARSLGT